MNILISYKSIQNYNKNQSTMSKSSQQQIFQSVISTSVKRLQQYYAQTSKQQLDQFKERLKLLDKGVKELDANPYFFLFIYMVSTKSQILIQQALKSIEVWQRLIQVLLSQHFLSPYKSKQLWKNLISVLKKTIPLKPQQCANIISQLTHPNLQTFELILEVLQYTQSQKVQSSCINLLGRLFEFKYIYAGDFHRKVAVQFEPSKRIEYGYQLVTAQEQDQLLTYYVKKIVVDMVDKIEIMQGEAVKGTGKFGLCFMCRQLADHYCKDTKVSVCSSHCKKAHLQQLQKVSMGTVKYPIQDKSNVQILLFRKLAVSQNSNVRSFVLWCLIKILSLSDYKLQQKPLIHDLITDTLDFKKNLLHFYYLYSWHNNQLCENIYYNLFLYSENQEYTMLLQNYFIQLFSDPQLLKIYYNFDMQKDRISIIKQIIFHASTKPNRKIALLMIEQLLATVRNSHPKNLLSQQMVTEIQSNSNLITLFNGSDKGAFETEISKKSNEQKALFVYKNQRFLNKQKVAVYLTKQKNIEILNYYLNLLNLNTLELELAIRQVFFHISPRQSQQIYRLLVQFCKIYKCERLPKQQDLLLFCYLIIMIQTELHNPIVEKRTTFQQMIKRVSDFNKTLSQDTEYMTILYRNIQNRAFSQTTKSINFKHYQDIKERQTPVYHPALVIYQNWQTIFVSVSADLSNKSLELAYKSAVFLIKFKVAEHFLHLILRQLYQRQFVEPYTPTLFTFAFDLILRQPNHTQKQWSKIFFFIYRYQNLRQNVNNGTRPDLIKDLQIASTFILDDNINQLFQVSQILQDSQLVHFCQGVSTIPLLYFLYQIPVVVKLNFSRLNVFWKILSTFIGMDQNYILKTTCFAETIRLVYTVQAPDQDHINTVIKDSLNLLEWTPQKESQFFDFVITIINNCSRMFTNQVWELLFEPLHKLSINNRIIISSILKEVCPIFTQFIKNDIRKTQNLQFLQANKQVIIAHHYIFESQILKYKNQQVIRFFMIDTFKKFILNNVDSLPPTKQLYSILTTTEIEQQNLPKLQNFLLTHLASHRNIESESIYLIIHLMASKNKIKGFQLFEKLLENNKIQVSQYEKDFTNTDSESKPTKKDYDTLVRKTLNQVTILNCLSEQLTKIQNDILEKILIHIDGLISSSISFNRNIPLRFYLWKNGLVKSLKQLPGLLKTERSSQMVRFSILNKLGGNNHLNDIVIRWNQITERLVNILKQWKDKQKSNVENEIKIHHFNEIQREITDYKKLLPKLFGYFKEIKWQEIQKQNKLKWLSCCCRILTNGLFRFKQQGINTGNNVEQEQLGNIFQLITSSL